MAADQRDEWIVPTKSAKTLPVVEILTGRGFITGKSGSGKSNSGSVIAEELLEENYNLLIVDPEGEYYGLKEKYEILHVGNGSFCDVQVAPEHADQLAEISLDQNMPIILDVSEYLDGEVARDLIANVVRELFEKEKEAQKPLLVMIEEMQEYLPQQGGSDELGNLLERIAKRGRKRGLGMLGLSQRPSSVDKDFITQCDWMVWHRLTWQNDIDVVRRILGSEKADEISDLDTGEGFLMTDWDESVERVQFKRKQTHDAGATPGLESYERPNLKSVSAELIQDIKSPTGTGLDVPEPADDLQSLDPAALREQVESLQRRNQILEKEVDQLQTELETVEKFPETEDETDAASPSNLTPNADGSGASTPLGAVGDADGLLSSSGSTPKEAESGSSSPPGSRTSGTRGNSPSTESTSNAAEDGPNIEHPPKPVPPEPPANRDGVAGNIVEFVAMLLFLLKSFTYRARLLWYRIRWGNDALETA